MGSLVTSVAGVEGCRITRCGYTGEDGVEISILDKDTAKVTSAILESKVGNAQMTGLGARDSLRLEAGLLSLW
jgi:aminomethyltransferase